MALYVDMVFAIYIYIYILYIWHIIYYKIWYKRKHTITWYNIM
jgi:hypothetical protein